MRQSPRRVPNMEDVGAEGVAQSLTDVSRIVETTNECLGEDFRSEKDIDVGARRFGVFC